MDKKKKGRVVKAGRVNKTKAAQHASSAKAPNARRPGRQPKKVVNAPPTKKAVVPKHAKAESVPVACTKCQRSFATERGLKMHQRWPCKPENEKGDEGDLGSPEAIAEASSDSDSDDAPLGKSIANRRLAVAGEAAVGKSSDLGAQLKGKLQSKLTGPKAMALLSCQRCGLGFDPKRDGPRCKHCTREEDDESGDEEDKEVPDVDAAEVTLGPHENGEGKENVSGDSNAAGDGGDPTGRNLGTVQELIRAVEVEQQLKKNNATVSAGGSGAGKDLECPVCGKLFTKKYYLQRHLQMTSCSGGPPPAHPCEVCGKIYSRKDNLREHLRAHAGEVTRRKKYKCEHCGKTFHGISLLKIHIRTHTGERPFVCDFCSKGFPSVTALNKHRRIHTGEKPYSCAECGMRFSLKGTLNRHTRIHTGIRPHKCPYCGKEFIQGGGLKAHLFHHTGMNGFKCSVCDKVFNRKARLDLHMKYLHLKLKPHVCGECNKGFTRREDLTRHSVLHTGEKPYQCPTCHKRFAIKPSLKIHMVTHTKEEPRSCHECGRAFIRKDCLMRHMRKRHRDLLDRILLDEEDDRFAPTGSGTAGSPGGTGAAGAAAGAAPGAVARVLSEQALCESIRELLGLLVDEPTLKGFGYPEKPVDELLEAVIRRCGHSPASPDDYGYMDRLRENSKLLFTVVIDDNAVKTLLNNQTVDEVILHVLRLAKS